MLLLHIPVGSGHTRAAQAVAAGLERVSPGVDAPVRDAFRYINRAIASASIRMYMDIIRITPAVWSIVYRQAERMAVAEMGRQEMANLIRTLSAQRVLSLLDETRPDTVVATHPFPLALMAELKRRGETSVRLVGTVTDFTVHPFWMYDEVDNYTLAAESLLTSPTVRATADSRLWLTGIPIDPQFGDPHEPRLVKEELGFSADDRVVLVMGGGLGLGPIERVVGSLMKSDNCRVIVVAGRNESLVQSLKDLEEQYSGRLKAFGYVAGIPRIMAASDVLISKAGGLTAAEALAKNLPIIILSPIPGQEQRNAEFLIARGAALRAESPSEAAAAAVQILGRPRLREAMLRACAELGKPRAAVEVAKLILGG